MGAFSFHGPITPGGPNLTFEGTAQEIYEQIKVLNPEYDQWQFPEFKAKMAARGIHSQEEYENAQIHTRSLDPRGMSGNPAHILRLRDGQVRILFHFGDPACSANTKPSSTAAGAVGSSSGGGASMEQATSVGWAAGSAAPPLTLARA